MNHPRTRPIPRPVTGKTVLLIALSAFGVIIAANLALAMAALGTFPGLEVRNSYVASQDFNARLAAQTALGWQVRAEAAGGQVWLRFTGPEGGPVEIAGLDALVGAATHTRDDRNPDFRRLGPGVYVADLALRPGNWNIRLSARAMDGTAFQQRLILDIR